MGLEVGDRPVAGQGLVADRGDDPELGGEHPERDVEADLVVAGAGRAVGHRRGADRPGHFDDRDRLLGALRRDRQGVDLAPEHVALDEPADEAGEDLGPRVHLVVLRGADRGGLAADGGALPVRGAAGVHMDGVDGPALLGEPGDTVGGVEPAGEGEGDEALLHIA